MIVRQYTPYKLKVDLNKLICIQNSSYVLKPFDELTIDFLDNLAKLILSDKSINRIPEIVALGFWLRKSQINRICEEQLTFLKSDLYKISPLGKVLHICPANVDTMFMYSMVVSLLMGNRNILRISRRMDTPHVLRLFEMINILIEKEEFDVFKEYINIIGYDHDKKVSDYLSSMVNGRLIWGGDETIRSFQTFEKSPRTKDIVFADRISMMVLDSKAILEAKDKVWTNFLRNFYNDAYTFDQMGCASPQTIYFLGSDSESQAARVRISNNFAVFLLQEYDNDIFSLASLKLNRLVDDALNGNINSQLGNNLFKLLELSTTANPSRLHGCGGGYFYYRNCSNLEELESLKVPKIQTITHFGLSKKNKDALVQLSYGEGIDRIVALGNALNFHYIWDGYNLFHELSRKVFLDIN